MEDLEQRLFRQSVQLPPQLPKNLHREQQARSIEGSRPAQPGPRTTAPAPAPPAARTTEQAATTWTDTEDRPRGLDRFRSAELREHLRRGAARAEARGKSGGDGEHESTRTAGGVLAAVQQRKAEAARRAADAARREAEEEQRRQETARQAERAERARRATRNEPDHSRHPPL